MIKINLLSEPDDSYAVRRATIAAGSASFLGVIFLVGLQYFLISGEAKQRQLDVAQLKSQLAAIKEKTKEVSDLDEQRKKLEVVARSIAEVKLQQIGPVRLLEDLNSAVPERVWLTEVEQVGDQYNLKGIGLNDFVIATFQSSLEQKGYVQSVSLKESATAYLTKVISFNSADSLYTFFVTPADKLSSIGALMRAEAKERGLQVYTKPPPKMTQQNINRGVGTEEGSVSASAGAVNPDRLVGWGRFVKRPDGIYYWNVSEGTEAKSFSLSMKYDFMSIKPSDIAGSVVSGEDRKA